MANQGKGLIIFTVFFLLALIIGGFFLNQKGILEKWRVSTSRVVIINKETANEETTEKDNFTTTSIENNNSTNSNPFNSLEESEAISDSEIEETMVKAQELSAETEALILRIQEFIQKREKEKTLERSLNVKGVYITETIANSQSSAAIKIRNNIKKLLEETEINAVVIDIKEASGPNLPSSLKELIKELHQKNIWVIARICAFRDSSQKEENSEWYLKKEEDISDSNTATSSKEFWRDSGGEYWLDPASEDVQNYIIEFSKKAIDFGFDELQFDYIRFPSDGEIKNIAYPFYDGQKEKYEVIREFFLNLSNSLRGYNLAVILSADLFGYVAIQYQSLDIGQRLIDAAETFDYISFMLYPSHFYGGFLVREDTKRQLPSLYFSYEAKVIEKEDEENGNDKEIDISQVVSNRPYEVVLRSIFLASDYLISLDSQAKIRPWLQDFNLKVDTERGIYYDAGKVKAQIKAAEDSGASGWLLWNPSNVYTKEALRVNP